MTVEALPRAFDGEAMRHDLTAVAKRHAGDDAAIKAEALNLFRTALIKGRERAKAKLEAGAPGLVVARDLSDLQDALIGALYDFTVKHIYYAQNPTAAERVAVVAVGGYGRGLLAPGSDVDLLFLLPYKQTPWGESVVEYMLYMLWDLGLTVGHATRSLDECIRLAKGDMTIRTSLLEARYLWGDAALCAQMKARFWREVATGSGIDFVDAKLGERDGRHRQEGESRYRVEPNIKDGKGGMRDLNTLFWIAKYLYRVEDPRDLVLHGVFTEDEFETFASAERFLWNVRCHLHFLAGRAEERLTFDVQREMAIRMGYGEDPKNRSVERFMTDYFRVAKDVGDLTRIFSASLETQRRKSAPVLDRWFGAWMRRRVLQEGFFVEGGRLNVEEPTLFEKDPVNLLRLFALADERSVDIHPAALKAVTRSLHLIDDRLRANKEANRLFMGVLSSPRGPERILRLMNEAGVFGAFIPDFGRIVARMQFNMYHHYTVDEHLIRAVGNLSLIERGELRDEHPLAAEIIHKIHSREALYLSVLLHDIAKGRDEDHSTAGERVAYDLGPRLGLSDADTETVAWLVLNHLVMSDTAQRRDIADPKTVRDFVSVVQSPERLKLLVCLTVADIRAVGPGVWNGWKGQLLRELYYAAEAMMLGGHAAGSRAARIQDAKKALGDRLRSWPAKWRSRMLERQYDPYWLTFDAEEHERHARLMRAAEEEKRPLAMDAVSDDFQSITRVTIYTADHPGLFSRLSGALALAGASILEAKIFTTTDGMALDTFFIQDAEGQPIDEGTRLKRIETAFEQALSGEVALAKAFAGKRVRPREAAFKVEPRVIIDNEASDICTVIEVNGRDRPGLLHDLTRTLFHVSVSIHSAQIATYGERAIDVFYVKDAYGMKVLKEGRLAAIKEALLDVLGDGGVAPAPAPEPSEPAAPGGKPARAAK